MAERACWRISLHRDADGNTNVCGTIRSAHQCRPDQTSVPSRSPCFVSFQLLTARFRLSPPSSSNVSSPSYSLLIAGEATDDVEGGGTGAGAPPLAFLRLVVPAAEAAEMLVPVEEASEARCCEVKLSPDSDGVMTCELPVRYANAGALVARS